MNKQKKTFNILKKRNQTRKLKIIKMINKNKNAMIMTFLIQTVTKLKTYVINFIAARSN